MARGTTSFTTSLLLIAPISVVALLAAGSAEAATPTYYNSLPAFQADITSTVTDDYSNPGYVFIQNNAVMSAVIGQTDYMSTGFNNLNIVSGGYYCAGCNGSFQLSFQTTTVGNAAGVNGVGALIQIHDMGTPYYAYITFADGTTANIALPAAGNFWGVAAPERIQSIHFGLSMAGTTTNGSFGIDNLIVGDGNVGGCVVNGDCFDNGDPCTDPVCVGGMCGFAPNVSPCDDGNVCTDMDTCSMGVCAGSVTDCEDGNPCTTNFCDPAAGCVLQLNSDPCDDGDSCTEMDACSAGTCTGTPLDCNDDNVCSVDSCDPVAGCMNEPTAGCCVADEDCGADELCDPVTNTCVPASGSTSGATTDGPGSSSLDGTGPDGTGGSDVGMTSGLTGTSSDGATGVVTGIGELPPADFPGCGCTTTPSGQGRVWWLMAALGLLIRRRRNAA